MSSRSKSTLRRVAAIALAGASIFGGVAVTDAGAATVCVYKWTLFKGYRHTYGSVDSAGNVDLGSGPILWERGKCPSGGIQVTDEAGTLVVIDGNSELAL